MKPSAGEEDAARPMLGFRPALEGLRGVAVLAVVLFHAEWLPGGFLGVDLFLVLSGFLITTLLLEEWRSTDRISLRDFFIRRALRLYPALALYLLAFTGLTVVLRYADVATQLKSALWSAVYLANVPLAYDPSRWFATELTHLWTLAAEAQFYLIWPPILVVLLRQGVRLRSIAIGVGGVILAVALVRAAVYVGGAPWERVYFGPEMRFDTILLGCVLAALFVRGSWPEVRGWIITVMAGVLLVALVVVRDTSAPMLYLGGLAGFALVSAVLVMGATEGKPRVLARVLSTPVLMEFGRVSYSWYLWHVLWLAFVNFTLGPEADVAKVGAVIASFVTAEISYRLVEVRFLRLKGRFTKGREAVDPLA